MGRQYQGKTQFYQQGRLGYAKEALRLMAEVIGPPGLEIADMGSGTGLLSEALLKSGYKVCAVEPDEALQKKAVERLGGLKGFFPITAQAESTGLAEHSVEAVTAASAFHWFNTAAFSRECRRILKSGGHVFLIYNIRQSDDSLGREQECLCRQYCPGFTSFHHGADKAKSRCPDFFSGGWEEVRYPYDLVYTKEQFLARCLSSSYSPSPGRLEYPAYLQALKALIQKHAAGDFITLYNQTVVWYGRLHR